MAQVMTPISPHDLIKMIATMNYNDPTSRGMLVSAVERGVVPWLPVGKDQNGEIYRILPGADGLKPDQLYPKTDRELASLNVLGVNTNAPARYPARSRQANLSEES